MGLFSKLPCVPSDVEQGAAFANLFPALRATLPGKKTCVSSRNAIHFRRRHSQGKETCVSSRNAIHLREQRGR